MFEEVLRKLLEISRELRNTQELVRRLQDEYDTLVLENEQQRELLNECETIVKRKINRNS